MGDKNKIWGVREPRVKASTDLPEAQVQALSGVSQTLVTQAPEGSNNYDFCRKLHPHEDTQVHEC